MLVTNRYFLLLMFTPQFSFFHHLIFKVVWLIVTIFATCSMVTQIYQIWSEI